MQAITVIGFNDATGKIIMTAVKAGDYSAAFLLASRHYPDATF